jgi:hypothetical protein
MRNNLLPEKVVSAILGRLIQHVQRPGGLIDEKYFEESTKQTSSLTSVLGMFLV